MKRTLLIITFNLLTLILIAGRVERGYKALYQFNYFKAKKLFEKSSKKKIIASSYGLSVIYSKNNNPFHNLDSAYKFICLAQVNYLVAKPKTIEKIKKLGVDSISIENLKDSIDSHKFIKVKKVGRVESLQAYINLHKDSYHLAKAIELRNQLAFDSSKIKNTSTAYRQFINDYPESIQLNEAKNRFEERLFIENTSNNKISEYQSFIKRFSQSPLLRRAEDSLYSKYTKVESVENLYRFIKENPTNPNLEIAWRKLYKIYTADYRPEKLVEFRIDYPDYPFLDELMVDMNLAGKEFLAYKENGLWGFIDSLGKVLIEPKFEFAEGFTEGLALVIKDGLAGFINKSEEVIIPFKYEDANRFKEGLAAVSKGGYWGMIDRSNKEIIPINFEIVGNIKNDLILVADSANYGYYNKKGQIEIPLMLQYATDFKDGYAIVGINDKKAIINTRGDFIVSADYTWLKPFNEYQSFIAKKDSLFGIIDNKGSTLLAFEYDKIGKLINGRALVVKDGKYGYISKSTIPVIPLMYDYNADVSLWGEFQSSYAKYILKDKFGIIDSMGNKVFPAIFQDVGQYSENNFVAVKKRGKWGYSNTDLKLVIPYTYQQAFSFIRNQGIVKKNDQWGIINKEGDWLLKNEYDFIEPFDSIGYILKKDNQVGLIDFDLNMLLPMNYNQISNSSFSNLLILKKGRNSVYFNRRNKQFIPSPSKIDSTF